MDKQIIQITNEAATEIKKLLAEKESSIGIKVKVKSGGCSGLAYDLEYADHIEKYDEVIRDKDVTLIIDKKAVMYLIGTVLKFNKNNVSEGFEFMNPNVKESCGCGKSFNI